MIEYARTACASDVREAFAHRYLQREAIDTQLEREWNQLVQSGRAPQCPNTQRVCEPSAVDEPGALDVVFCTGGPCDEVAWKAQHIQKWKEERFRDVYWPDAKTEASELARCEQIGR